MLELLVVLAVVGMLLSLVAPNLQRLTGSIDRMSRRDGLLADLAGLSYRAYALGERFELSKDGMARLLNDGSPVLGVPSGWRVEVEAPIRFDFTGWCSGGTVRLVSPDGFTETLHLVAPDCRLTKG